MIGVDSETPVLLRETITCESLPRQRDDEPAVTAKLVLTHGPGVWSPIEVPFEGDTFVLGLHPCCDVVLDDITISRRHVELRRVGGEFVVTDLGSLNGTYVNRNPVDRATLVDGDHLWIGSFRLAFRCARAVRGSVAA